MVEHPFWIKPFIYLRIYIGEMVWRKKNRLFAERKKLAELLTNWNPFLQKRKWFSKEGNILCFNIWQPWQQQKICLYLLRKSLVKLSFDGGGVESTQVFQFIFSLLDHTLRPTCKFLMFYHSKKNSWKFSIKNVLLY